MSNLLDDIIVDLENTLLEIKGDDFRKKFEEDNEIILPIFQNLGMKYFFSLSGKKKASKDGCDLTSTSNNGNNCGDGTSEDSSFGFSALNLSSLLTGVVGKRERKKVRKVGITYD